MTTLKLRQLSLKTLILLFIPAGIATVAWQRYQFPPEVTWEEFSWKSVRENAFENRWTIVCYEMEWTLATYEFKSKVRSKEFARMVRRHSADCMMIDYYKLSEDAFFQPFFSSQKPFVVVFHPYGKHRVIYDGDEFFRDVRNEITLLRQEATRELKSK